ncbi:MAG: DUF429 domain-containing protein, partial [Cyanobacteria bacterium P01_A01_bin.105]
MNFLGLDLGWQSGPSGVCQLVLQDQRLTLVDLQRRPQLSDVLAWVDAQVPPNAAVMAAVDAPTIIPNSTGMRQPDRLAHQHYGRYHAGCYPANQGRPFAQRLVAFGQALEARGLVHAPALAPQQPGRHQIEVFPHPAMVNLFQLPRILKYKKGRLADRRVELNRLRQLILTVLPRLTPGLTITAADLPPVPATGRAMKSLEDRLDSLICAYVAAHYWWWGQARNQVLGSLADGYIVVPCPVFSG